MKTFFPLGSAAPESGGRSRPRWTLRADTTVNKLIIVVAADSSGTDGASFDTEVVVARAYFWNAPKRGFTLLALVAATWSPGWKFSTPVPTASTMPTYEPPKMVG